MTFFFLLRDAHDARQETTGEGYERFCRRSDLILRDSRVLFAPESANASKHTRVNYFLFFFDGCVSWQSEVPG